MAPLKPVKGATMQCKLNRVPYVLVFSNTQPDKDDLENLTADRWSKGFFLFFIVFALSMLAFQLVFEALAITHHIRMQNA
eukprot:394794-Prymnesium_polylepis.1